MKSVGVQEICQQWNKVLEKYAGSEVPVTSQGGSRRLAPCSTAR